VEVLDGDRVVASSGLVAATSVEKPSVIGKMWWYARRTAHNLWGLVT
jgi:hypothetical protein